MIERGAEASDPAAPRLAAHEYGKAGVRLAKLRRDAPGGHEIVDLDVDLRLQGRFEAAYARGDNSLVIATDSCRNALGVLADAHPLDAIESFARHVAAHFLEQYPQLGRVEVRIQQRCWRRAALGSRPHPTAFIGERERSTCRAVHDRHSGLELASGIEELPLLRSAGASFEGFVSDAYRSLPDDADRILATTVQASWSHCDPAAGADWNVRRAAIRGALIEAFSVPPSASLQHTLYAMGRAALAACESIDAIELVLPNQHYPRIDLARFGGNPRADVFAPADAPQGRIAGRLERADLARRETP